MITEAELIKICRENDNIDFIGKHDSQKIIISDCLADVEISALFSAWINPIRNDDISEAQNKILELWARIGEPHTHFSDRRPLEFIKSRVWDNYYGDNSRIYKYYDLNAFYYLCRRIWFLYVKENRESIEDLFQDITIKYYHQKMCRVLGGNTLIQNEKTYGSCANLNMFFKWMIHDLKRWDKIDETKLLIPTTHKIISAAHDLLIINNQTRTLKNAITITEFAKHLLGYDYMKMFAGLIFYYENYLKK